MNEGLREALREALGAGVRASRRVAGGDINRALCLELEDGRRVFVKYNECGPRGLFEAEARGLAWLAEARALRTPDVLAVGPAATPFLALEWIETGRRGSDFDESLGRGLALLHDANAEGFGLDHDNFIATLPQINAPLHDWPSFYAERRLHPLLRRAVDAGCVPRRTRRLMDELIVRVPELVGEPEAPSRLHGDLWGGNLMCGSSGEPTLIDPAVYGGHREVDLAMMRLFGGFGPRVFEAYAEARPLSPDHATRVPLYQLYPLLVHVLLFGGGYVGQLEVAARGALS